MFLYSIESFLPYDLNKAERDKDYSKVSTFGAFAYALNEITSEA